MLAAFVILIIPSPLYASDDEGKAAFRAGLEALREGQHEEAAQSFAVASENLPIIGDYALLYLAKARLGLGNAELAARAIEELKGKYPDSPLMKEARSLEVESASALGGEKALSMAADYLNSYPSDMKMKLLYGRLLKSAGEADKARSVFKEVYIEAGAYSQEAYNEIKPVGLSARELYERASHLIDLTKYREADAALDAALSEDGGALKREIKAKMGLSLFRQKRYKEAAAKYLEASDPFMAARSFFRAGDDESFSRELDRLVASGHSGAADLMVASANERRREGEPEEALALLKRAMALSPACTEEALWWTGWTHYKSGDYARAGEVFDRLNASYPSSKYLYWRARAVEKTGQDAAELFQKVTDPDLYGFMAALRTDTFAASATDLGGTQYAPPLGQYTDRAQALIEVGLPDEAARELRLMAPKALGDGPLVEIAMRLARLGGYREAIGIAQKAQGGAQLDQVLYPLAYWPAVEDVSAHYALDPFLLLSLIREESRFDRQALSPAGAIGLMQLMPETARRVSDKADVTVSGPASIYDAENNIRLGACYLSDLMKEFNSVCAALAAYNAGEDRVRRWLAAGGYSSADEFIEDIPYPETRQYVKRILGTYIRYRDARHPEFTWRLKAL